MLHAGREVNCANHLLLLVLELVILLDGAGNVLKPVSSWLRNPPLTSFHSASSMTLEFLCSG